MMWRDTGVTLIMSLIFTEVLGSARFTPPGKPKITVCRSPEKETFTCWWEPGSDGGLPTNYSLYYRKENSDVVSECPDYRTAGKNSCFFNKNDTSLWVNYNITVVATNALGSNFSDPVEVDVVYIVQPHTPENVTVVVNMVDGDPFLLVRWEPPRKADTRSGWITLIYELRVKLEKDDKWEEHFAGQQKQFNIFSPHSGEVYMVQVRCRPDHGFWSEWSTTAYVKVPDYISKERSMWVLIAVVSAFIFLVFTWTVNVKRNSVKHFLLPPVPGPKIKGFDTQLLKAGKSEEVFGALVIQGFPPTTDYEDLLVEYLEVYDNEEQELVLDGKDLQDGLLKSKSSSDSDSGRGSCDSHTLLMEKCSETKEDQAVEDKQSKAGVGTMERSDSHVHVHSSESAAEKVRSWPTVFSSQQHMQKPPYHSIPEVSGQCHVSGTHCPSTHPQDHKENPTEVCLGKPPPGFRHTQTNSDFSIHSSSYKREATFPPSKSMEYVEVQKVNEENMLVLKPIAKEGQDLYHLEFTGQDYSKVNGVVNDNVLLLQREMAAKCQETGSPAENHSQQQPGKSAMHTAVPMAHEGVHIAPNGYVDTATMLPTY
ncbi:prolactin receptor a [Megalops cyprinoides]|uniref:prolactin receptor a n=1 Tax=Megalops cyprinoides TaxID=118141 RepID=UPI001865071D|nr:prolactin receptor a [Megalops cyprinoides]